MFQNLPFNLQIIFLGVQLLKYTMVEIDASFKQDIYDYCSALISQQLSEIQNQINALKIELNSATKSSAGDKHETTRAMIHLEQEKLGGQLQSIQKQVRILAQMSIANTKAIQMGSLVLTDKGLFFIAVALGKITFQNRDCFVISPISPLAQKFLNASAGV